MRGLDKCFIAEVPSVQSEGTGLLPSASCGKSVPEKTHCGGCEGEVDAQTTRAAPFWNLWLADVVSLTGDGFSTIALFRLLLEFTDKRPWANESWGLAPWKNASPQAPSP